MNEKFNFIQEPLVIRGIPRDSQNQVGCYGTPLQVLMQQGRNLGEGFWGHHPNDLLPDTLKMAHLNRASCKTETSIRVDDESRDE
jgi:hypothetical protein